MEYIWDSSPSLGSAASSLWGGTFVGHYGAAPGFCLDPACDGVGRRPVHGRIPRLLEDDNVSERIDEFLAMMFANDAFYQNSEFLITMGGDFLYANAARNFKELEQINSIWKSGR